MSDTLRPLACTYCGGKLTVDTETTGRAYLTYEVPESITCDEMGCQAVWEPDGTPREMPAFVRFPSLYTRPDLHLTAAPARPAKGCNGQADCPTEVHIDGCRSDPNGNHYKPQTAAPTGPDPRTDAAVGR